MGYSVSDVLKIAGDEIGYREKETNSQLNDKTANAGDNNYTKYAVELHNIGFFNGNKNGYPWCSVFVSYCHFIASGKDVPEAKRVLCQSGPYAAGCDEAMRYYKKAKRFYSTPMIGDQIFFGTPTDSNHTGIVESISSTTLTTIEGNASNMVKRCVYPINSSKILGYGRPRYECGVGDDSACIEQSKNNLITSIIPSIKKGDIVSIAKNATYYSGKDIPDWVVAKTWIVAETSVGDRVVINKSVDGKHAINSPVHAKFLTVVKEDEPWTPKIGDIVNYDGNKHYANANAANGSSCKGGLAKITNIYQLGKSKHPYHLVRVSGKGATVYGWVNEGTFTKA